MSSSSSSPITVSAVKTSVDAKVGLRLNMDSASKSLVVRKISPTSLFADTELEEGMRILSINGLDTTEDGITAEEASGLIKRITGPVTIEAERIMMPEAAPPVPAEPVTVTRFKESTATKIGLRLGSRPSMLYIKAIAPDSMFADSELQPGMVIQSINGLVLSGGGDDGDDGLAFSPEQATNLLRRVKGNLTIVAQQPSSSQQEGAEENEAPHSMNDGGESVGTGLVTASSTHTDGSAGSSSNPNRRVITVYKETPDTKLGLSLVQTARGMTISKVAPTGLLSSQGLAPGMRLLSVNDVNVKDFNVDLVRSMMARISGDLKLMVEDGVFQQQHAQHQDPLVMATPVIPQQVTTSSSSGRNHYQPQQPPQPQYVEARVFRSDPRQRVGISLRCRRNGTVMIQSIAPDGLFAKAASGPTLQPGMIVESINGVPCFQKPHAMVVNMIASCVGELRIIASIPPSDGSSGGSVHSGQSY